MINTDGRPTIASKASDALLAQAFDQQKAERNLLWSEEARQRDPDEHWLEDVTGVAGYCPCEPDDIRPDCPFHGDASWPFGADLDRAIRDCFQSPHTALHERLKDEPRQ